MKRFKAILQTLVLVSAFAVVARPASAQGLFDKIVRIFNFFAEVIRAGG